MDKQSSSNEYWQRQAGNFAEHYQRTKSFWRKFVHNFLNARYKIITELINKKNNAGCVILDLGCGSGVYLNYCLQFNPKELIGIDYSEEMLNQARGNLGRGNQENKNIRLIKARAEKTNLKDESCDLILSVGLFDYLDNPEEVLAEVVRVLKRGGRAIITLPKKYSPFFFLRHWPGLYLRQHLFGLPAIVNVWSKQEAFDLFRRVYLKPATVKQIQKTMWIFELVK